MNQKITLVCMPWHSVFFSSFGLSAIKKDLVDRGVSARVYYANFILRELLGDELYNRISLSQSTGDLLFAPFLYDLSLTSHKVWFSDAIKVTRSECGISDLEFVDISLTVIPEFLRLIEQEILIDDPIAIGLGFSYSQNIANFSIVKKLKTIDSDLKFIGGGRAINTEFKNICMKEYGFDFVVEGDVNGGLVKTLIDHNILSYSIDFDLEYDEKDAFFSRPDHTDYFKVKNDYHLDSEDWYSIEFSKGCWWGEKILCTFCGLNGESPKYYERPLGDIFEEIISAHELYGFYNFSLTDNILSKNPNLIDLLSRVKGRVPDLNIFAQIKSNVHRDEAVRYKQAGISVVQPGIESFNSSILKKMNKGCLARQHIETLKNLEYSGIEIIYGILYGVINETIDELKNQLSIIRKIRHLTPPKYFSKISLDKHSPYVTNCEFYNIDDLSVSFSESLIYQHSGHSAYNCVWEYSSNYTEMRNDYDEYIHTIDKLRDEIQEWRNNYTKNSYIYSVADSGLVTVIDNRTENKIILLSEIESRLIVSLERGEKFQSGNLVWCDADEKESVFKLLLDKDILLHIDDVFVVLPILSNECVDACSFNVSGREFLEA